MHDPFGQLEALGYGALWLPETLGRDPFAHIAHLAGSDVEALKAATRPEQFVATISDATRILVDVFQRAAATLPDARRQRSMRPTCGWRDPRPRRIPEPVGRPLTVRP